MALFGRGDTKLPAVMKKPQTQKSFAAGELDEILQALEDHSDFDIQKNVWLFTFHTVSIYVVV